jgi:hypothetical protein
MMERVRSINESQEPKISAAFTFSFITLDIYLNNVKVLTLFCPASMYSKNHAWYTYIYIHTRSSMVGHCNKADIISHLRITI